MEEGRAVCPVEKLAVRGTNLIIFINLDRIGRGGGEGWGQKEEEEEEEDAGVEGWAVESSTRVSDGPSTEREGSRETGEHGREREG